jgi:DNA primase
MNLLTLISHDTTLRRTSAKHGGEYSGPCPFCRLGTDRFKVWPALGRWACLGREAGRSGCDISGDAIQYLRLKDNLTYAEACERLGLRPGEPCARRRHDPVTPSLAPETVTPPAPAWQTAGRAFVEQCRRRLWTDDGAAARQWLAQRGLNEETLLRAHIGYHPPTAARPAAPGVWPPVAHSPHQTLWLPRGIVLPWFVGGDLWRINVRRPLTPAQCAAGEAKYIGPAGFANGLYGADTLTGGKPVVLVEGELDALTVQQAAGDQVAAVAAGSTGGARRSVWVAQLALTPVVLVAFDADGNGAGDRAAAWWTNVLPNAGAGDRSAARMSTPCTPPGWMWPAGSPPGWGGEGASFRLTQR